MAKDKSEKKSKKSKVVTETVTETIVTGQADVEVAKVRVSTIIFENSEPDIITGGEEGQD